MGVVESGERGKQSRGSKQPGGRQAITSDDPEELREASGPGV